jgi:LysR family hydrogen peroxide-inducible transcriptional activator
MNLRDLHYITTLAETRHFGRAAEQCNVSQPTLSMQVKKLEEYLGVAIFERASREVLVTPAGEKIIAHAHSILRDADAIKDIARTAQDAYAGDFRLGAFPTLAPYYLPQLMPVLSKKLPRLKLWLVEEKTEILLSRLKSGALDAAFIALPIHDAELNYAPLFDDPFYLAVHKAHAFASRTYVHQDDIRREPLLLLEDGHCLRSQALDVCNVVGAVEHQEFRATSLETLRQMVASGVGVTLMPELAMRRGDGVVYVKLRPAISRSIALVWRKTTHRKACIDRLAAAACADF